MRLWCFLLLVLFACVKDDFLSLQNDLIISEEEQKIMQQCQEEKLTDRTTIEKAIPGKWILAGYACGFCVPHSVPSANLEFSKTHGSMEFEDEFDGKIKLDFSWKLEAATDIYDNEVYRLVTDPTHYALSANQFCENYMFFNHTPIDGQMFIYRKK